MALTDLAPRVAEVFDLQSAEIMALRNMTMDHLVYFAFGTRYYVGCADTLMADSVVEIIRRTTLDPKAFKEISGGCECFLSISIFNDVTIDGQRPIDGFQRYEGGTGKSFVKRFGAMTCDQVSLVRDWLRDVEAYDQGLIYDFEDVLLEWDKYVDRRCKS